MVKSTSIKVPKHIQKIQKEFADSVVASLEQGKIPWLKSWIEEPMELAYNEVSLENYRGINQLMLTTKAIEYGYDDPRWISFKEAKEKGYRIKAGAKGVPVFNYAIYDTLNQKNISELEYRQMSPEEQVSVAIETQMTRLFNAHQVMGMPKRNPKEIPTFNSQLVKDFKNNLTTGMNIDVLTGERSHYDEIQDVITMKSEHSYSNELLYYGDFFKNIGRASNRSNGFLRKTTDEKQPDLYQTAEDLRLDIFTTFLSQDLRYASQSDLFASEDKAKQWASLIKGNYKNFYYCVRDAARLIDYVSTIGHLEEVKASYTSSNPYDQTIYVSLYGGPGSGKTTSAHSIVAGLKKQGIECEYVGEVARDYIYDGKTHLLDGSLSNELDILKEKNRRLERLNHKVQVVVSDAPLHASGIYFLANLEHDQDEINYFQQEIKAYDKKYEQKLNYFIKRGSTFEQKDRYHNEQESLALDDFNLQYLKDNKIEYNSYTYQGIPSIIDEITAQVKQHELESREQEFNELDDLKSRISIKDYAIDVLGLSLTKESSERYRIEEYDSCKIFANNTFHRFSNGRGGTIIDFIKEFEEVDTKSAIERMKEYDATYNPQTRYDLNKMSYSKKRDSDYIELEVPDKASDNNKVIHYLHEKRGIHLDVINDYINKGILYQDKEDNCVFLGRYEGIVHYGMKRSTTSKKKKDLKNSFKAIGIYIDNNSETLILNEATLDQMSYQCMVPNRSDYSYLSVNGVSNACQAYKFHMEKRSEAVNIKRVIIGFDNDSAGMEASLKVNELIKEKYPHIEVLAHTPKNNDFNEDLMELQDINFSYESELSMTPAMEL